MNRVRVQGHSNLYKDLRSGALINTDAAAWELATRERAEEQARIERLSALENKMSRIEALLEKLVNDKPDMV